MRFRTATRADVDAIVAIDHVASSEGARVEFDRSGTIDNLDDGDPELVYLERLAVA